ncbi:MAG: hypothetical protein ACP5FH_10135 [Terracidiphilus sp.]
MALGAVLAAAQQPASMPRQPDRATAGDPSGAGSHLTDNQTRQLDSLVDELMQFSSQETGLPIRNRVKRQIVSRATVEKYLRQKIKDDQTARRMQHDEIVLKKFGLLDRDFFLRPFLLALLDEQIEAYYDARTRTVYLLDWISPEEQKPVLAHELTHALQDQHSDLLKWSHQTPDDVSLDSASDTSHLTKDEMDTARQAVIEGQATAVMVDYMLKPFGKTLVKNPELIGPIEQQMAIPENSPVMARAPLLLSESLLFPYREGLGFEQSVWVDQGRSAAFAGTLDRPPTSSWEILNPRAYETRQTPPVPLLPNIHPLVDKLYQPYDIGQVGQLDVRIMTELFGGDQAARDLTPAWDGGLYWAGQLRSATAGAPGKAASDSPGWRAGAPGKAASSLPGWKTADKQADTASIALFYLSVWKNSASAQAFARLYANELNQKYSGVKLEQTGQLPGSASFLSAGQISAEQVYSTSEGPVVLTIRGRMLFVAESFPLELARKLAALVLDAQGSGAMQMAETAPPGVTTPDSGPWQPLTGDLVRFFSDCGVMKAAVDAGFQAGR